MTNEPKLTKRQAAIIGAFTGITCGPFGDLHQYAEELFGESLVAETFGKSYFAGELKAKAREDFLAIVHDGAPVVIAPVETPVAENVIQFPIGDWSGDGHSHCEYFSIKSNKTVTELREIHFRAPVALGFDIGDICEDYEENILDGGIIENLLEVGFSLDKGFHHDGEYGMDPESVFRLWVDLLKFIDPSFEFECIPNESLPTITFYGSDSLARHLNSPGYGVFE